MRDIRTSRRAVMCALAVTPIAIAPAVKAMQTNEINALASPASSFMPVYNRFMAIWMEYNNAPADTSYEEEERLGDIYIAALNDLIKVHPTTDREFRLKFLALWDDGGSPREDIILRVLDDANRLGWSAAA